MSPEAQREPNRQESGELDLAQPLQDIVVAADRRPFRLLAFGDRAAALKAYAPYSGYSVGCAILSSESQLVTGADMENACYRLRLCAEQSALTAAQHAFGLHNIARIAVAGGNGSGDTLTGDQSVTPCGGCRQALLEANHLASRDFESRCASGDGKQVERLALSTLIPHGFGPASLSDAAPG